MAEVKRGFRKVTMVIPLTVHARLTKLAEMNLRDVGQQAAYYVQAAIIQVEADSIKEAYNGAVEARESTFVHDPTLDGDLVLGKEPTEVE
jgi:hypothetical protein